MRRWLLSVALGAALLGASPARGDVLVPYDPGLLGYCGAASGDLVAVGRMDEDYDLLPVAFASTGAPGRTLAGVVGCPVLDAAPDGTAVLATQGNPRQEAPPALLLRGPDGALRTPLRFSEGMTGPIVAAAPGGWAAAAWLDARHRNRLQLVGALFEPDGSAGVPRVLDRVSRGAGHLSSPVVGVDASGNATFAWTAWRGERRQSVRTTAITRGGVSTPVRELPAGAPIKCDEGRDVVDLAVSPGGRTLVAWTTTRGVRAKLGGGAPVEVVRKRGVRSPHAEIADDGTAFVAFAKQDYHDALIYAVDHDPEAGWSRIHELTSYDMRAPAASENADIPVPFVFFSTALGPDGHGIVAWQHDAPIGDGVAAALRNPAGTWLDAALRSPVTRTARLASLSLDARGRPLLLWREGQFAFALDPSSDRLRGARVVADAEAPPPDVVTPSVTAVLPSRVGVDRAGRYVVDVTVGCAEACDVRLRVLRHTGIVESYEDATAVAEIAAGATATLQLITDVESRPGLRRRLPKRLRINLLATDAFGNVSRRSQAVRAFRR